MVRSGPPHRRIIALPGRPEVCECAGEWLRQQAGGHGVLWAGRSAPPDLPSVRPAQAGDWLGRERDVVVFEAQSGLPADALVIVSGILRGGGVLVLLTDADGATPFGERWRQALAEAVVEHPDPGRPANWPRPTGAVPGEGWTDDQQRVLERLRDPGEPDAPGGRRCDVVIAPRGRGKSTVLGQWLGEHLRLSGAPDGEIAVTAPAPSAAERLLAQAAEGSPVVDPATLYRAPAVLLDSPARPDLLIVDEAAAIPVERLLELTRRARRVVLATTTGGFEGSGQGFRLRVLPALERDGLSPRILRLHEPVRWAAGDPLEDWINRLFLLEAASHEPSPQAVRLAWRSPAELAGDAARLEALTGLLADAHYRTRPSDLQRWLDDPDLHVLLLEGARDGALFGAVLVQAEPGLEPELAGAVWAGERRPPGRFLPCTLAAVGSFSLAAQTAWRIHRIAVHPAWQGRGLGTRLLRAVAERAARDGVGLLGAAFGVTPGMLHFWQREGFAPVRLGVRPDPASGQVTLIVMRALAEAGEAWPALAAVQGAFARDWPLWRALAAEQLDSATTRAIEQSLPAPGDHGEVDADDRASIEAFAHRSRSFEWALPALRRALAAEAARDRELDLNPGQNPGQDSGQALLHAACVQQQDWAALQALAGVSGRRGVIRRLREAAARWLAETRPEIRPEIRPGTR
ncbi:tRNA(Met)-cytidine N(4)-acetyltransferase [Thioalkalivibrio sp. ALE21]|uniref:GNAT family N-acetyltransferase n=1 Tax=Thioalkalivibrio sp. ALE21 TaxID=1158175 RepID=UPI000D869D40|nr:GNAT family N-acetyltransferase [Thioalkalivibrio sp. ALE21]PYG03447.1 tRNA(Met)-cytidine N(4)-acetyltransferase [Thioalkalivibrio sp. ALE21]